jgi:hypothetical protein
LAKRETKETYTQTKDQQGASESNYEAARANSATVQNQLAGSTTDQRAGLTNAYQNFGQNVSPISYNPVGASVGNLTAALGGAREFGKTGGFTPGRESSIMENVAGLKNIGATGGLSSENIERMRGLGGFDEFAKTGGYTPESIANIKAQALSPIGSYASGTRDELARRRSLQGGYAPGFDAANRQLSRDTARQIANTSLNANVGIQDRINAGRQWGIGGLAQAEGGIAGMQSQNKLAGYQGAGNMELQLQNMISNYRGQGLSMEQATARAIDDLQTQTSMFNSQQQQQADQYNADMALRKESFGVGGLQGLYNTDVGQYQNERDRANALLGGQTQSNLGYLNNQTQLAVQPGIGGNVMGAIGAGAGLASDFFLPNGFRAQTAR